MNEKQFKQILFKLGEQRAPDSLDLWPEIKAKITGISRNVRKRRALRMAFSLSFVLLAVSLLFLALSPGLQKAAAQVIHDIGEMVGIAGDAQGPESFSPVPPFTVLLPGYLPKGLEYVSAQYIPGESSLPSIREERAWPGTETVESTVQSPISRYIDNSPTILLRYKGGAGQYFELFERSAQLSDKLPDGETFTIHENTARLRRDKETITLTWIEAGTWIELTGKLPVDELMMIASGLVVTQTPQDEDNLPQATPERKAIEATERSSFCNPEDYVPNRVNLLGDVSHQKRRGEVRIDLFFEGQSPFPATVAWGSNVENYKDEVFKPALEALRVPSTEMTTLPYKAIGMYVNVTGCMEPNPAVRGYFVIEVWENQVNIGYGGDALALRERAIQALEEEMERIR